MFKMKTITLSLLALLLVMSFASCASDNISDFPIANDNSKVFLSVSINVAGRTLKQQERKIIILNQNLMVEKMEMDVKKEKSTNKKFIICPFFSSILIRLI